MNVEKNYKQQNIAFMNLLNLIYLHISPYTIYSYIVQFLTMVTESKNGRICTQLVSKLN